MRRTESLVAGEPRATEHEEPLSRVIRRVTFGDRAMPEQVVDVVNFRFTPTADKEIVGMVLLRFTEVGPVSGDAVVDDRPQFLEPPSARGRVQEVEVTHPAKQAVDHDAR